MPYGDDIQPSQPHLYWYTGNDPVNFIDPEGLSGLKIAAAAVLSAPKAAEYAQDAYYTKKINDIYAEQQSWIYEQMAKCENLEEYDMLDDALKKSVRNQARDTAKFGIATVQITTSHAVRVRR